MCVFLWSDLQAYSPHKYLQKYCLECHDTDTQKGSQDLETLKLNFDNDKAFETWIKVFDSVHKGEMPPKKKKRPDAGETAEFKEWLFKTLTSSDKKRIAGNHRSTLRRLTATEYENTMRDLFDMPGLKVKEILPADGSAHRFDKNNHALSISHVNIAKFIEAAEHTLDYAIATRPNAPKVNKQQISLACRGSGVAHIIMNGDGIQMRDKKIDPEFPAAGEFKHIDEGAHEMMGSFERGSTVGLFRHEDESVSPYFRDFVTIYPGMYKVRTSLWSFQWDKGKILPSRRTEAGRLSVVQLTGDGRGGQHPSYVLGYYDAPSLDAKEHEEMVWMNRNEQFGFNTASLAPVANYARKGHAMAFTGPGIAVDWLTVEGPFYPSWPPPSHKLLFGDLPLVEFKQKETPNVKAPIRNKYRQLWGKNRKDQEQGIWTVESKNPMADADTLLSKFLPKAFRRPVEDSVKQRYLEIVKTSLESGECFENAMRLAYKHALCSPDFLFHVEQAGELDDYAFANRLSYFLTNSSMDDKLLSKVASGKVHDPKVLHSEVERMLNSDKSARFIKDFLGQWLKINRVAANDPDKKLYPEFSPYLQDSMVLETESYFKELLKRNLQASYLVKSDFIMINGVLARLYGFEGIDGPNIRAVKLPEDCPRGGLLTQASVLKVTANGTTTSPVVRGTYVMERIIGNPPKPPPPNAGSVEPDVQGTTTIRELLDKHRSNPSCASCHANIDPPGFAMESFDVIGGYRKNYRTIGNGKNPERGMIDPFIGIGFKIGSEVDSSGNMPDGKKFSGINEFKDILAADEKTLLTSLANHLAVYSTGREISFSERTEIDQIVYQCQQKGGGIRTLVHELVKSPLFRRK